MGCCFSCAATWRRGAGGFWGFIRAVDFEAFEVMGVEMNEETGEETGEDTESGDGGGSGGSGGSVGLSAAGGGKAPRVQARHKQGISEARQGHGRKATAATCAAGPNWAAVEPWLAGGRRGSGKV